jgi:hypothetical protein
MELNENENLSLGDMAGMGEVSLPSETSVGSGDIPAGKGDAEEEYKKKRNKKKQREMKNIISFESFGSLDEGKTISSSKISMMGARVLNKISIGTIFDTEDGNYEITDYGRQANAFKEFEAEHNGKKVKVKLTAMYGVKLEVTDDVRSARFNKEVKLNSIILESVNEGKFDGIADLVKSLHFEMDPKTAEEKKIELGKRQGEVSRRKQIEGGEYSLRRFRKEIKYDETGEDLGVFKPGSYMAATSILGDGPHKKAVKKVRWNRKKYDQWIEDMAANDGWKNAFDMAQNAKHEPGLLQWAKKEFRGEDVMQRIQWDIEGYAESVVTESISKSTKIHCIATPAPKSMLKDELEELFGDDYRNIVTEVQDDEGYESVLVFNLTKRDIKLIEDNIGDVLIWEYSIKPGKLINESVVNEAEKYITDKFKVGDKIKTNFGEWEVIETDYAPKKSFIAPFIFKGKNIERVNIPNPPKTNKNAVGYKVTDGAKYPTIGFLYQYKDITKLATVGVDESIVTEAESVKVGEYIKTQYGYFYKRVDGKVGGQEAFVEIKKGKEGKRKTSIHDTVSFEIVDKDAAFESLVTEKKHDREDTIKFIKKYMRFVKTTEEFNGSQGGIWVSGEDGDEYKGVTIYDYYTSGKSYELGVNIKWEKELNERGWYSEWYDAGTVMIWEI